MPRLRTFSVYDAKHHKTFIERHFTKRECTQFIPVQRTSFETIKSQERCGCGRLKNQHSVEVIKRFEALQQSLIADGHLKPGLPYNYGRWTIGRHTTEIPTDAYGTIEFQGGPHPHKALYVRISFDTEPDLIFQLFENIWGIERPKLVISVHGGIANFSLQPKLARVFRKGLLKAAKTTGAWIITSGLNAGVVRHVTSALGDGGGLRAKKKIVTIGIAPWGLLSRATRDQFSKYEATVPYHPQANSPNKSRFPGLNEKHSFFLLVDNGTVGRYGADIIVRKRFEEYLSRQLIEDTGKRIPVVSVVLEGGTATIRGVIDYVTNEPPIPVVVCDGSGRAADLLAFTQRYMQDDGTLPDQIKEQLIELIQKYFGYTRRQAEKVYLELVLCVRSTLRQKHLITVFRLGSEESRDIDHAILFALLKGQDLTPADQLSLTLTWNRVDIARSDILVYGHNLQPYLNRTMLEALVYDRVEFVKLLLQNGVCMERFLTFDVLEELYNSDKGPTTGDETLRLLVEDVVKYSIAKKHVYSLYEIGLVIQKLMAGAYKASYCKKDFQKRLDARKTSSKWARSRAESNRSQQQSIHLDIKHTLSQTSFLTSAYEDDDQLSCIDQEPNFKYPFNELIIWAILMRRKEMALLMWQHGEEALAKSLIACKMYKSMSKEAAEDYLEVEICDELNKCAEEFRKLSFELLEFCYNADDDLTYQLLTYELSNWGKQTCLSLAALANHKEFLAHPGCQVLLADLWHGGMRIRRSSNIKVLLGIFFPPFILKLDFKNKDELLLQPQTKEEHIDVLRDDDSITSNDEFRDNDSVDLSSSEHSLNENNNASMDGVLKNRYRRDRQRLSTIRSNDEQIELAGRATSLPTGRTRGGHLGSMMALQGLTNWFLKPFGLRKDKQQAIDKEARKKLRFGKKIYEFYVAPITTYWFSTISYTIFLVLFSYMVLIKTPTSPTWVEIYILIYIITYGCDLLRKFCMTKPLKMWQKWKLFRIHWWDVTGAAAVVLFLVAFALRLHIETLPYGRVLYCCDIIYWYLLLLDFMSVSRILGPYIFMVGKMVSIFCRVVQACGDRGENCVIGAWLTPAFMAAFLLVANILLINLIIAVFNNIFAKINSMSQEVWKSGRFYVVMEYERKPFLPPPLIIFCHLHLLYKYCRKSKSGAWIRDFELKLFLHDENIEKLHDFEEECMDDHMRQREAAFHTSSDERIRRTADRMDLLGIKFDDFVQKQQLFKSVSDTRNEQFDETLGEISTFMQTQHLAVRALSSRIDTLLTHFPTSDTRTIMPESSSISVTPVQSEEDIVEDEQFIGEKDGDRKMVLFTVEPASPEHDSIGHDEHITDAYLTHPRRLLLDTSGSPCQLGTLTEEHEPNASASMQSSLPDDINDCNDIGDLKHSRSVPTTPNPSNGTVAASRIFQRTISERPPLTNQKKIDDELLSETYFKPISLAKDDRLEFEKRHKRSTPSLIHHQYHSTPVFYGVFRRQCSLPVTGGNGQHRHSVSPSQQPPYARKLSIVPRNEEYTSITDCIDTSALEFTVQIPQDAIDSGHPVPLLAVSPSLADYISIERIESPIPSDDFDDGMGCSRMVTPVDADMMTTDGPLMQHYDGVTEQSSSFTAGKVHDRIRGMIDGHLDSGIHNGIASNLFEQSNNGRAKARAIDRSSSSQESIKSSNMETKEGFQQINECLLDKQMKQVELIKSGSESLISDLDHAEMAENQMRSLKPGIVYGFDDSDIKEHLGS